MSISQFAISDQTVSDTGLRGTIDITYTAELDDIFINGYATVKYPRGGRGATTKTPQFTWEPVTAKDVPADFDISKWLDQFFGPVTYDYVSLVTLKVRPYHVVSLTVRDQTVLPVELETPQYFFKTQHFEDMLEFEDDFLVHDLQPGEYHFEKSGRTHEIVSVSGLDINQAADVSVGNVFKERAIEEDRMMFNDLSNLDDDEEFLDLI